MKLRALYGILTVASLVAGSVSTGMAQSSPPSSSEPMAKPKPGPETAALLKLFGHGATWKGEVPAGALGPDSPATTSHGRATCGPIVEGFWCACELEDTMGPGKNAMVFRGRMTVGYDLGTKAYRATLVDNTGLLSMYNGQMGDGTFTLETPEAIPFMGTMVKDRLTFVMGPNGTVTSFKDEHQAGDGAWTAFETAAHMTPLGATHHTAKPSGTSGKTK